MSHPVAVILILIIFLPVFGLLAALGYTGWLFTLEAVRGFRLRRARPPSPPR